MQINSVKNVNFGQYMVSQEAYRAFNDVPENPEYDNKKFLDLMKKEFQKNDDFTLSIQNENVNLSYEKDEKSTGVTLYCNVKDFFVYPFEVFDKALGALADLLLDVDDEKAVGALSTKFNRIIKEFNENEEF